MPYKAWLDGLLWIMTKSLSGGSKDYNEKSTLLSILLLSISLSGCSADDEIGEQQAEHVEINQETQDDSEAESTENIETKESLESDANDQTEPVIVAPTREEVLSMRELVLEGISATETVYKLLHDMDYYLLRYGPEDVGKYTQDNSVAAKYYGVLNVYAGYN